MAAEHSAVLHPAVEIVGDVAQRTLAGDGVQIERLRLQEKFQLVTRCHKRIDHAEFQAFEVRAVDAQRLQRECQRALVRAGRNLKPVA